VGVLIVLFSLGSYAVASEFEEFGFEAVAAEESDSRAGQHPDVTLSFVYNHEEEVPGKPVVPARTHELSIELPPGLVGDPAKFPICTNNQFENGTSCPVDSQVGVVEGVLSESENETFTASLYNLEPPKRKGAIARFGFQASVYQTFVDVSVRTAGDYGVTATVHNASGQGALVSAKTTLWGVPASPAHNGKRLTTFESLLCPIIAPPGGFPCFAPGGERPSGLQPKPFVNNPTACEEQEVRFRATSYQLPGQIFTADTSLPPITNCDELAFEPSLQIEPTSQRAGAATGLHAKLRIPQTDEVNLPATSAMRGAKVVLPEGMTLNTAAANGLEACSDQQVALGEEVASKCPPASKLGTAVFVSPALPEPIHGAIYQRSPVPGNLFRIWLVTDEFGLHLKLPGVIKPDLSTGRITTEFLETPQLPVEEVDLEFWGGAGAPLKNSDSCGTYSTSYQLSPWSGTPLVTGQAPMTIDEGCGDGGFSPRLEAGATNPVAGSYSPFAVDLKREDDEDNVSSFELTLPKGQLAKLKGVPLCSDADAATGNCPAASQIGSVAVAAGAGPQPLWVPQPGKAPTAVFLAGPYKGAPYSVVTKVPAQAGPFDLGTVTVRGGLYVDPDTTQATVKADPLPQILEGVPVLYRTIHVSIDRDQFAINPTNCREQAVNARVTSAEGAIATPADRFQVGDCAALGFAPSLKLRLKGGTKRGSYPALTAVLKTHKNEANIGRTSVALPHSEFLAQEHIKTICTGVQFAEEKCPAGSIYGRARAVTPLLEQPLEGPVYLRSSSHPLPDLVVSLHGQLDVNLVGRIDSVNGGIRTTFSEVPDAPVTKFILKMRGGKKSLLVNSTDICANKHRATVKMAGQNGKVDNPHPLLRRACGGH
jgi:hypothetical protein